MRVYYNDNDSHACQWTRNLIEAGLVAGGFVDERSIDDVRAEDLVGFTRCHFFSGVCGWEYALQLAGWADHRPCWTASLPCQPFSTAGRQKGEEDERHLWPVFFRLFRVCRPAICYGEQVDSDDGYRWFAGIRDAMEKEGYAVGCLDLPACSQGAPHKRNRLFWVAVRLVDDAPGERIGRQGSSQQGGDGTHDGIPGASGASYRAVGDAARERRTGQRVLLRPGETGRDEADVPETAGAGAAGRFWDAFDLLPCTDEKYRRTQPGLFPLVAGLPFRLASGRTREGVSRRAVLRGIGNSIVPHVAAAFVRAFLATEGG